MFTGTTRVADKPGVMDGAVQFSGAESWVEIPEERWLGDHASWHVSAATNRRPPRTATTGHRSIFC